MLRSAPEEGKTQASKKLIEDNEKLTKGNRYRDTIHSINSAIINLGRGGKATPLFRGVARMRLPDRFHVANERTAIIGGTEYGIMSATADREQALHYATYATPSMIIEIQQGMVGRGGDLSWLSQYPEEKETCFPPCTALEMMTMEHEGARVPRVRIETVPLKTEEGSRQVIVYEMRSTVSMRKGGYRAQVLHQVRNAATETHGAKFVPIQPLRDAIKMAEAVNVPIEKLGSAVGRLNPILIAIASPLSLF